MDYDVFPLLGEGVPHSPTLDAVVGKEISATRDPIGSSVLHKTCTFGTAEVKAQSLCMLNCCL